MARFLNNARRAEEPAEDTWASLWTDAALWLDRYEKVMGREIQALRLAAPGIPENALRADLERGASPMSVARYYAAQQKH